MERSNHSDPGAADGGRSSDRSPLQIYLDAIRPIPVLTREETVSWAERRVAGELAFRRAVSRLPAMAILLVERWSERRAAGLVTGVLADGYRDARDVDWSSHIDTHLAEVDERLARREALIRENAGREECEALEGEIAKLVEAASPSLGLLIELFGELERLARSGEAGVTCDADAACDDAGAAEDFGREVRRQRLGLQLRATQEGLHEARRALREREEAVRVLVRHNLKLVVKFAKRYRGLEVAFLDLIQEGNIGLVRAAEKFEPSRGFSFSTYGVWWIEQAVIRGVQNLSRAVRVPAHVYDRQLRYRQVARELRQEKGREPSRLELAAALELKPEEVDLVVATTRSIRSTEESVPGTDDLKLEDLLPDGDGSEIVDAIDRRELRHVLDGALRDLRPREREILEWRFGLRTGESQTLEEIGRRIGLSRERVRQIQQSALARLRRRDTVERLRGRA